MMFEKWSFWVVTSGSLRLPTRKWRYPRHTKMSNLVDRTRERKRVVIYLLSAFQKCHNILFPPTPISNFIINNFGRQLKIKNLQSDVRNGFGKWLQKTEINKEIKFQGHYLHFHFSSFVWVILVAANKFFFFLPCPHYRFIHSFFVCLQISDYSYKYPK